MKYSSLQQAFSFVSNDARMVSLVAVSEPLLFYGNAHEYLGYHHGMSIYCANPSKPYKVFKAEYLADCLELRLIPLTYEVKYHQKRKHIHYVPQHLS